MMIQGSAPDLLGLQAHRPRSQDNLNDRRPVVEALLGAIEAAARSETRRCYALPLVSHALLCLLADAHQFFGNWASGGNSCALTFPRRLAEIESEPLLCEQAIERTTHLQRMTRAPFAYAGRPLLARLHRCGGEPHALQQVIAQRNRRALSVLVIPQKFGRDAFLQRPA